MKVLSTNRLDATISDSHSLTRLLSEARSFAARHGFLMHTPTGAVHVTPFTLLPSPLPRAEFTEAFHLATILTRLTIAVARDQAFILATLRPAAAADPFLTNLLNLLSLPRHPSRITAAASRFDFFVSASTSAAAPAPDRGLRLVEMNLTAAGAAMEADLTSALHRSIATHPAAIDAGIVDGDAGIAINPTALPDNAAVACITDVLARAHAAFVAMHSLHDDDVRAIMVVAPPYENICDQDSVRALLLANHSIDMPRIPLTDIALGTVSADGLLRLSVADAPTFVVSTAYFRCGYDPCDYAYDDGAWAARALLEKSTAISVPSAAMQLAGTKKMLQALSDTAVLERFVGRPDAERVAKALVRQWDLGGDGGDEAVAMAMRTPDDFVLKPQRDGGGNNLFRDDIKRVLAQAAPEERAQYVLQERIHPASVRNIVVREDKWEVAQVVRELGVFGAALAVDDVLVVNDARGHVTRSKKAGVDGGGICAGVAFMDSPRLED